MSHDRPNFPSCSSDAFTDRSMDFGSVPLQGYDYDFDPPPGQCYECPICLLVLREPRQTKCGHRFCRDCILHWLRESGSRCPVDNEPLTEKDIFPDTFAKREILMCNVKCPNSKDGCEMFAPLGKLQNHLDECAYTLVPCPYQCVSILPRHDMQEHIANFCLYRFITCDDCNESVRANEMENHHTVCCKRILECNFCKQDVIRQEMEQHLTDVCKNVMIHCPFYNMGCRQMMERNKEAEHLNAELPSHMKQICSAVNDLKQIIGSEGGQAALSRANILPPGLMQDQNAVSTTMSQMNRSLSAASQQSSCGPAVFSPNCDPEAENLNLVLTSMAGGQDRRGEESADEGNVDASLSHRRHNRSGQAHHQPGNAFSAPNSMGNLRLISGLPSSFKSDDGYHGMVTRQNTTEVSRLFYSSHPYVSVHAGRPDWEQSVHLLNSASANVNAVSITKSLQDLRIQQEEAEVQQQKQVEDLIEKVEALETTNRQLTNRLKELEVKVTQMDSRFHCGDFYWSIQDFDDKKMKSCQQMMILHSAPFLTSPWGYKLCLRVNISGLENANGERFIALFIHLMKGENDHILNWPFTGKIILSLIDQNPNCEDRKHISETLEAKPSFAAFQKPIGFRNNKGFGYTEFVSIQNLEQGHYIMDDTLMIRAQVFPSNMLNPR